MRSRCTISTRDGGMTDSRVERRGKVQRRFASQSLHIPEPLLSGGEGRTVPLGT